MARHVFVILLHFSTIAHCSDCGPDGYTVTNFKNRGYLKLHKVYQPADPQQEELSSPTKSDSSNEASSQSSGRSKSRGMYEKDCFKCWKSGVVYDVPYDEEQFTEYSHICSHDPKFYQVCGTVRESRVTKSGTLFSEWLCGFYVCLRDDREGTYEAGWQVMHETLCRDRLDSNCVNTDADRRYCNSELAGFHRCGDDKNSRRPKNVRFIEESKVCDGRGDCVDGEDEIATRENAERCRFGISCQNAKGKQIWIAPSKLCDGVIHCQSGEDEANCVRSTEVSCSPRHSSSLNSSQLCTPALGEVCISGNLDQTSCPDPRDAALSCVLAHTGLKTTVSRYSLCNETVLCEDEYDGRCVRRGCVVHKQQICDHVTDCSDGSDEINCDDVTKTETCVWRLQLRGVGRERRIPLSWLCDGERDCEGGEDEDEGRWRVCRDGNIRICREKGEECHQVFKSTPCSNCAHQTVVHLDNLCRSPSNGNQHEVCKVARDLPILPTRVVRNNDVAQLLHCLDGLQALNTCPDCPLPCQEQPFTGEPNKAYGVKPPHIRYPIRKINCKFLFGEAYVYAACQGICQDPSVTCPLNKIRRNSCSEDRTIYTLSRDNYLTKVWEVRGEFVNNMFACDNGRCVGYDKVCNLDDDCGDGTDERECSNQFICKEHGERIPLSSVCNKKEDCTDHSDECNLQCGARLVKECFLQMCAWVIGISAVSTNGYVVGKYVMKLGGMTSSVQLFNSVFMVLIACGDFLVGVYLVTLGVVNTYYSGDYCRERFRWRSSSWCSFLGIINTTGTYLSMFSMSVLGVYRAQSLWRVLHRRTLTVSRMCGICCGALAVFLAALSVALTPELPWYQDYFMNGLVYEEEVGLFLGPINRPRHVEILERYYGRFLARSHQKSDRLSWNEIKLLVREMFTQFEDTDPILGREFGFYGNDGVCLFKYFVQRTDSQRYFVWSILGITLFSFLVILVSYIVVYCLASNRPSPKSSYHHSHMQRKITLIILTDFLCWVPFTITCFLNSADFFSADDYYEFVSILVLPLNSLINPLLYDRTLSNLVGTGYKFLSHLVGSGYKFLAGHVARVSRRGSRLFGQSFRWMVLSGSRYWQRRRKRFVITWSSSRGIIEKLADVQNVGNEVVDREPNTASDY